MKKNGEDQPPKKTPSGAELKRLADNKPTADMDTAYQDNKGTKKTGKDKQPKNK